MHSTSHTCTSCAQALCQRRSERHAPQACARGLPASSSHSAACPDACEVRAPWRLCAASAGPHTTPRSAPTARPTQARRAVAGCVGRHPTQGRLSAPSIEQRCVCVCVCAAVVRAALSAAHHALHACARTTQTHETRLGFGWNGSAAKPAPLAPATTRHRLHAARERAGAPRQGGSSGSSGSRAAASRLHGGCRLPPRSAHGGAAHGRCCAALLLLLQRGRRGCCSACAAALLTGGSSNIARRCSAGLLTSQAQRCHSSCQVPTAGDGVGAHTQPACVFLNDTSAREDDELNRPTSLVRPSLHQPVVNGLNLRMPPLR
jgi:hypothetical protein